MQNKVLAFLPAHNSEGKKDVTGAFQPEARTFLKLPRNNRLFAFDNRKSLPGRRVEVLLELELCAADPTRYTSIAFFCHGWLDGIQAGFQRRHVTQLAAAIRNTCINDDVVVALFCCSTGADPQDDPLTAAGTGDDSFADKLRDALCVAGAVNCRVMAHTTVAHTTKNPMVLFMDGMGVPTGGVGGYPPVSPKSSNWAAWKKALQNSDLRYRMPYMTPAEIHAELAGANDATNSR